MAKKLTCCERAKLLTACGIVADLLRMESDDTHAVAIARNWGVIGHTAKYLKEIGVMEYDLNDLKRIL